MLRLVLFVLYLVTVYSLDPAVLKSDQNAGLDPNGRTAPTVPTTDRNAGLDPNG